LKHIHVSKKKSPTTTLLIKSLSKLSKESLHLFTDFSLSSTGLSEYVSIRKLHVTLESKYKLWKTLYDLGFKYAKINGNKKALVERKNLAKNRIFFYVKLSKLPYATIILYIYQV
jgi:hypothetical protein